MSRKQMADGMGCDDCLRTAKRISIIPDSDVLLKVGTGAEALDIMVSGADISKACAIFSKMLTSPFQEAETKVINMPEDEPRAVLAFSYIAHQQSERIGKLTTDNIVDLILLSDKYLCQEAVKDYLLELLEDYIEWINLCTEDLAQYESHPPFPHTYAGLRLEDMIVFATVFELKFLFRLATEIYHVLGHGPLEPSGYEAELPLLWCGDLHLFGK